MSSKSDPAPSIATEACSAGVVAPPRRWRARPLVLGLAIGLWGVGVIGGTVALWRYKSASGAAAVSPPTWPAASPLERATDRATLVMLAHPQCPCTSASMDELASLVQAARGRVRSYVVFLGRPAPIGEESSLVQRARAIPGVRVVTDATQADLLAWGAKTSGQVVLYDAEGRLAYRGGITDARGHAGDSVGKERILTILDGREPGSRQSPVFGCDLHDPPNPDVTSTLAERASP